MLIGNRSVLHKSPARFLSGTVASIDRSAFAKPGMMRSAAFEATAAVPYGHLSPSAWLLPKTEGGMSSRNFSSLSMDASGAILGGVNGEASATITFTVADATGGLITSGSGSASISFDVADALLTASIGGTGAASITFESSAQLGAEASIAGASAFSFSGTLTPYAIGIMEGTTEEAGLTPSGIANAVWSKAIEAGYTADQIMRILAATAAGAATGLEGGNPQFTGLDGTTVRVDGTYSAGTRTIDAINAD